MAATRGFIFTAEFKDLKGGLEDAHRSFKKAGQGAREFGSILGGLSSEAGAAGKALGAAVSGLAAGGPMGLAIAGVQLLVETFKEQKKQAEEVAKANEAAAAAIAKAWSDIRGMQDKSTEGQKLFKKIVEEGTPAFKGLQEQYQKISDAGPSIVSHVRAAFGDPSAYNAFNQALEQAQQNMKKYLSDLTQAAAIAQALKQEQQKAAQEDMARAQIAKDYQTNLAAQKQARQIEISVMDEQKQIEAKRLDTIREINLNLGIEEDTRKRLIAAVNKQAAEEQKRLARRKEAEANKDYWNAIARQAEAGTETEGQDMSTPPSKMNLGAPSKAFLNALDDAKAKAEELKQTAVGLGEAFGSAFAGMAAGTMTVGQAFAQMGQAILKVVMQTAIQSITASAGEAAAGAAASQAGIPIVGPALAAGAMAAMFAMVMGLIGSIGSAAGGWDLPAFGGGQAAVLHSKEMVLPAHLADRIRGMTDTAAAGVVVNFNISALDGKQAYQVFKRRERELFRVIKDATADRRY